MKKTLSIIIAFVLVMGMFSGCSLTSDKPYSNYTEVCNTEEYYERPLSLPVGFQSFSIGNYMDIYASYNGSICKFTDAGELRITYEDTLGFSAPYFYDGYIYSVSNGCLYKIDSSKKGTITQIGERMDGTGANCVVVNDSFALITLHHYNENNKFSLKLMRVDLGTGEATELDLGTEQRLYCSAGGVMYVYTKEVVDREEVYSLYEIPVEGEPIYICDMTDVGAVAKFVLEEGVFYYGGTNGDLCAKSLITGDITTCVSGVGIFDMGQYMETGMAFYQGNIIYFNELTSSLESIYTPNYGANGKKFARIVSGTNISVSHIDFSKLSSLAPDVKVDYRTLSDEEITLKLLAGDSDADVYFISPTTAKYLMDKGIYTPIESEIVDNFNNSCFDYIAEFCRTEDGKNVFMPISNYVYGMVYPIEAQTEVGFEREDVLYYDDFMELARNHGTDRHVFQYGEAIHNSLHMQYGKYYCDFENGVFDFTTDVYKGFFAELWTYTDYENQQHSVFTHPNYIDDERYPRKTDVLGKTIPFGTIHYYPQTTLFSTGFFTYHEYADTVNCPTFAQEWRAVPMPRISDRVTGNYVYVEFAFINPYSDRKDAAIAALEAIAQNHMKIRSGQTTYTFLLKDKSAYSNDYLPESQVFNDFYDIAADGFIFEYHCGYPERSNYAKGLVSLEDELNDYQRQVNIWLNE